MSDNPTVHAFLEECKEIRAQRHDFIKEYYKMATADLDRHLKAGWQTIVVLGGGAAILTAGHDAKLGLPIATSLALISALWGALTVIDANYWSLRAIGFLANVEAVYFASEDRAAFNPYIGFHPQYKLLNSLRYMFWLCVLFGLAALASMAWEITNHYATPEAIMRQFNVLPRARRLLWMSPILLVSWGTFWLANTRRRRLRDYLKFSERSPGPGVRRYREPPRHVDLSTPGGRVVELEDNTQTPLQNELRQAEKNYRRFFWLCPTFVFVLTLGLAWLIYTGLPSLS